MKLAVTLVFLLSVSLATGGSYFRNHPDMFTTKAATVAPEDAPKGSRTMPGKLTLDDPDKGVTEFAGDKGKVPFDHDQHAALDTCVTCHHTNSKKLTKAVEEDVQKCVLCHKDEEKPCEFEGTNEDAKFKGKDAPDSQTAYHGKGSGLVGCIDCHKTRKDKFPKAAAVIKCAECHVKG